jgi:hypothetical protein
MHWRNNQALLVDSKVALVASARYVIDAESRKCRFFAIFAIGLFSTEQHSSVAPL